MKLVVKTECGKHFLQINLCYCRESVVDITVSLSHFGSCLYKLSLFVSNLIHTLFF